MTKPPKGVREFYDKTAREWADRWYADDSMLPLLRRFMALLLESPRVLDLCCGAGYESGRMAALGAQIVGIDLSGESIAIARDRNPALTFHEEDMLNDYDYTGPVDAVVCIAGLVHLSWEQLRCAFERMDAVLRPGGRLLLVIREGVGRQAERSDVVIDGECYDRAFYAHTLDELRETSAGMFAYEQELADTGPSVWRNYVFCKPE